MASPNDIVLRFKVDEKGYAEIASGAGKIVRGVNEQLKRGTDEIGKTLDDAVKRMNATLGQLGKTGVNFSGINGQMQQLAANVAALNAKVTQTSTGAKIIGGRTVYSSPAQQAQALSNAMNAGAVSGIGSAARGALSAVNALGGGLSKVQSSLVTIGATIYSLRSVGQLLRTYLVSPIVDFGEALVSADEESRKFEYAISGIVGSMARAREINAALVKATRELPISITEARESARALAALPNFAAAFNRGTAGDAVNQALAFGQLSRRLAALDPVQGQQGALAALREVVEGGGGEAFNSIRRRFGFTGRQIARAVGSTLEDVKRDPQLALRGVKAIVETLIPDEVLRRNNSLISVRVLKIRDSLRSALSTIADSGVFDSVVKRLDGFARQAFAYLDSGEFQSTAKRVSNALDRIIGNIGQSLTRFLRAASGTKGDTSTIAGVADGFTSAIERLARLSDNLPSILSRVGDAAGAIASRVGEFVDAIVTIADAIRDPKGAAMNAGKSFVTAGAIDGGAKLGTQAQMLAILRDAGIDTGLVGRRYYDPKTNARDVYDELRAGGSSAASAFLQSLPEGLRGLIGSRSNVEQLDFSRLPIGQRATAEKIYAALIAGNQASPTLLRQLGTSERSSPEMRKLQQFIRGEFSAPNYGATLLSQNRSFGNLSELAESTPDALGKLLSAARAASEGGVQAFGQLKQQRDETLKLVGDALQDGAQQYAASFDREILVWMNSARKVGEATERGYRESQKLLADSLLSAGNDFAVGVARELESTPLVSEFIGTIAAGTNAYARQIREALEKAGVGANGKIGLDALELDERAAFVRRMIDANSRDAELRGRFGNFRAGMSAEELLTAFNNRSLSRDNINRLQLAAEQGNLQLQGSIVNASRANLVANPDDPFAMKLAGDAAARFGELAQRVEELRDSLDYTKQAFIEFSTDVRSALDNNLGNALENLIMGVGSLGDVFRNLARDIVGNFSQIASKNIIRALLGDFGTGGASGLQLGGLLGALGGGLGRAFGSSGGSSQFAGWNFGGGVKAYASGGIVDGAQLALVGEGGPETIIPLRGGAVPITQTSSGLMAQLPGGRGVPARFNGDGFTRAFGSQAPRMAEQRIFVVADMRGAVAAGFREGKDALLTMTAKDIARGGTVSKAIRRSRG
jgi:hypothetical protein